MQPIAKQVRSYIKDTNDFLKKLKSLPKLPDNTILCTIDVVGLYPNIPNEDGLKVLREALDRHENETVLTDSLIELAELVLKNNFFEFDQKYLRQNKVLPLVLNLRHHML